MIIHKMIERSHPDTVEKYMTYYGQKYGLPDGFTDLKDGIYSSTSPYDDYHYRHDVDFEIANGQLIAISYDGINRDGHSKKSDSVYNEAMNANVYGSAPSLAYDKYEKRLLDCCDGQVAFEKTAFSDLSPKKIPRLAINNNMASHSP